MSTSGEPIVFLGSGPVSAASLKAIAPHFNIEAVITKRAPAHHKGSVPVVELVESLQLPVEYANTRSELDDLIKAKKFKSRLGIIVDYGVIVSQAVIDSFPLGIINSHFSLLPEWRGADPITFSVLSGQPETGVSLMLIVEKLDEGALLAQSKLAIEPDITTPKLTDQLVELSNHMLKQVVPIYLQGNIKPYEQPDDVKPTYSRKLTKKDSKLDWTKPAELLEREVRAFIGWPGSITELAGKQVTIIKAHVSKDSGQPGTVSLENKQLTIYCGTDGLVIDELKPAGKKEMTGWEFAAGHKQQLI